MLVLVSFENSYARELQGIREDCIFETKPIIEGIISDCEMILGQADKVIKEQHRKMMLQQKLIDDQFDELDQLSKELELQKKTKDAWYKNPWLMIGLGVIAGGAGVLTLSR